MKTRLTIENGDTTDDECLQIVVFAANMTIGLEGLCKMILVFGAPPRPARIDPS